jgi:hypothetical protein
LPNAFPTWKNIAIPVKLINRNEPADAGVINLLHLYGGRLDGCIIHFLMLLYVSYTQSYCDVFDTGRYFAVEVACNILIGLTPTAIWIS